MTCFSRSPRRNVPFLLLLAGLLVVTGSATARIAFAEEEGSGSGTPAAAADSAEGTEEPEAPEGSIAVVDTVIEAAGGRVRVDIERTSSDLVRMGESLVVPAGQLVKGDAVVIGGNLDVYGTVNGDAVVVGGTLHLHDGCVVHGEAVAVAGTVVKEDGAAVGGQEVSIGMGIEKILPWSWTHRTYSPGRSAWLAVRKGLIRLVLTLFAVLVFVDLFSRPTARVANKIREDYFRTGLAGMLAVILTPVSILVLVISIVGILLLPFLGILIGIAFVWGWVAVSLATGRTLGGRFFPDLGTPRLQALLGAALLYTTVFAGELILGLGGFFAFAGWTLVIAGKVITTVAFLIGFGAVLMTRFGRRGSDGAAAEEPAVPATPTAPAAP